MSGSGDSSTRGVAAFQATRWSLVLAATQPDSTQAREALAKLCETYWYPLYAFIRRQGYDRHQAKDLTQGVFAQLIEKQSLQIADRERGRFRSFLMACARHFLSHERKKAQTLKRGGQCQVVSLDEVLAEKRYGGEPADELSPEKLFDRRWALTLLDQAMAQLESEYAEAGKRDQFEALQVYLSGAKDAAESYAEVGRRLDVSESGARQAAYRMRCRFGELLRMQVAQTVSNPQELEVELNHLRSILSG